jgi:hypothetical protein
VKQFAPLGMSDRKTPNDPMLVNETGTLEPQRC